MKVKELIKILEECPSNAEVCYIDTYWESEGWNDETKWNYVYGASYDDEEDIVTIS